MNVAWQLPLWGATVPGRLATGCSRRCATATAPALRQADVPRQAELVICDKSIERTLAWLSKCRGLLVRYEKKAANYLGLLKLACGLIWFSRYLRLAALR
jgi:transposase